MRVIRSRRLCVVSLLVWTVLPARARGEAPQASALPPPTRTEMESLLLTGNIASNRDVSASPEQSWRITVDDGRRTHAAYIETAAGGDAFQRYHQLNVAAYELDKLLGLNMVTPSVERVVQGRSVSVTWFVDGVLMDEMTRATRNVPPPDPDRWNKQMQVVRVFDELMANAYRTMDPGSHTSKFWDNLLITTEWRVWLTDHTRTFMVTRRLEHPESLVQCDRTVLSRLRALNKEVLRQTLQRYLSPEQIDALEVRRDLLVKRLDEQIASRGENAVLFDLPSAQ